jgi:uncharacterized OsmC-like protein
MKTILLLCACALAGCSSTQTPGFTRRSLLQNIEFQSAEATVAETDATGRTNRYEHWKIEGLKSDQQRALSTIEKLAEKLP